MPKYSLIIFSALIFVISTSAWAWSVWITCGMDDVFEFQWRTTSRFDFVVISAKSAEDANNVIERICRSVGRRICGAGRPTSVRKMKETCGVCTQVDIRELGWEQGSKNDFCKTQGFEGVKGYRDTEYIEGGACYIGSICDQWDTGIF